MTQQNKEFNPFFDEVPNMTQITFQDNEPKLPTSITKICRAVHKLHPYISKEIILQVVLVKVAQMLTSKRIQFDESGKKHFPNWFVLIFLESGGGKDRLVDDFDNFVFPDFIAWYKKEVVQTKNNIKGASNIIPMELEDATQAGIYALAKELKELNIGCIFIRMAELGLYIKNANKQQLKYLSDLCKLSDCKIQRTLTKSNGFTEEITNIPINVLAYSDQTIIAHADIIKTLEALLASGLCRRFTISYQEPQEWNCTTFSDEEERALHIELQGLGKEIYSIFLKVSTGACYTLTPNAKNCLNQYKEKIKGLYNKEVKDLLKKEIRDRIYKALKLSCLFACLNHPEELQINPIDIKQAINTVEFLSTHLENFINIGNHINTKDKEMRAFEFLKENYGRGYCKTELIRLLCKHCGYTRRGLLKFFDNGFYGTINDIAHSYGYYFCCDTTKVARGTYYFLKKYEKKEANPTTLTLDEIEKETNRPHMWEKYWI